MIRQAQRYAFNIDRSLWMVLFGALFIAIGAFRLLQPPEVAPAPDFMPEAFQLSEADTGFLPMMAASPIQPELAQALAAEAEVGGPRRPPAAGGNDAIPANAGSMPAVNIPERLVIPAIKLDAPVVSAELTEIEVGDKVYRQWLAPNGFAAGWHHDTAGLGTAGNTVLNGHHNVAREVFRNLEHLEVGDLIFAYSGGRSYSYEITHVEILPERSQPLEVRLANARWIQSTEDERLTLVTCWPYVSNTHRLIVVASPTNALRTLR